MDGRRRAVEAVKVTGGLNEDGGRGREGRWGGHAEREREGGLEVELEKGENEGGNGQPSRRGVDEVEEAYLMVAEVSEALRRAMAAKEKKERRGS